MERLGLIVMDEKERLIQNALEIMERQRGIAAQMEIVAEERREVLRAALEAGVSVSELARRLSISRQALYRALDR